MKEYLALLEDPRVGLYPLGSTKRSRKELLQRIYDNINFICMQLELDQVDVRDTASDPYGGVAGQEDEDPIVCQVCQLGPSLHDVIVKCEEEHEFEVGYHARCLPKVLDPASGALVSP